ncbi:MAG TPA: hypothetical protein PKE69_06385 [Pyrinomonadaceae bacterium]|nr:hypothetical protein [Pyrinomonadaceae bacterium]
MNSTLATKRTAIKSIGEPICVFIKPCIEKQELNYSETFLGTPEQILNRSREIINGLKAVFRNDDFSVRIVKPDLTQMIVLDSGILFDSDFNEIGKIEDYLYI